jgi:hypothetical protein
MCMMFIASKSWQRHIHQPLQADLVSSKKEALCFLIGPILKHAYFNSSPFTQVNASDSVSKIL